MESCPCLSLARCPNAALGGGAAQGNFSSFKVVIFAAKLCPLKWLRRNIFGQYVVVKKGCIRLFGILFYIRLRRHYRIAISGSRHFRSLPSSNVLIVSNHQTYFADVSFFLMVIHAALHGEEDRISLSFLRSKKHEIYYVAAEETMRKGILPRLLALSGAVTIQRNWRLNGQNVRRKVSKEGLRNIDKALKDGWVITFPQGTTTPYTKGRLGTALLIKEHQPVVVPIVIDGFRRGFDKTGLRVKKKQTLLKMKVKAPLEVDCTATAEVILEQLMKAIEQSPEFDAMQQLKDETERQKVEAHKSPPRRSVVGECRS